MTLTEIQAWIRSAKYVDTIRDQTDSCDNRMREVIYEKDGKFFRVENMNGIPHPTLTPVRKASRMEYVCEWVK